MILSMTGYGRGEVNKNGMEIISEARSLNNRFLELSIRFPKDYSKLESEIKEIVKRYASRGRINLTITLKSDVELPANSYRIDTALAQKYMKMFRAIIADNQLSSEIKLSDLIGLPHVWVQSDEAANLEDVWPALKTAIELSLEDLYAMRKKEGEELARDLRQRLVLLEKNLDEIEQISKQQSSIEFKKMNERLQNLIPSEKIEPGRLEMEIAMLADRVDVTEECIRFRSHTKIFLETMDGTEPGGRRLNFVLQEMNREANTIGAKANNAEIARFVIQIKDELEKIREQVQNIE
ncbi:YicC family protein [candidate division KSB1 bacterium]|nr:YicC family protein [candidate division KSB1 bacterium]